VAVGICIRNSIISLLRRPNPGRTPQLREGSIFLEIPDSGTWRSLTGHCFTRACCAGRDGGRLSQSELERRRCSMGHDSRQKPEAWPSPGPFRARGGSGRFSVCARDKKPRL